MLHYVDSYVQGFAEMEAESMKRNENVQLEVRKASNARFLLMKQSGMSAEDNARVNSLRADLVRVQGLMDARFGLMFELFDRGAQTTEKPVDLRTSSRSARRILAPLT